MTSDQELALKHFNVDDLVMSTTAYYLGRSTAMVASHCESVIAAWPHLSSQAQDFIHRIVESAFTREARLAAVKADPSWAGRPLGHESDRKAWMKVRNLWNDETAE